LPPATPGGHKHEWRKVLVESSDARADIDRVYRRASDVDYDRRIGPLLSHMLQPSRLKIWDLQHRWAEGLREG
jgi:hypothetical protein